MSDQLSPEERAQLEAELDAEAGRTTDDKATAVDGLFSLGHIALAGMFGAGFGGVVLAVQNDRRLGAPAWRTVGTYILLLLASVTLISVALPPGWPRGCARLSAPA